MIRLPERPSRALVRGTWMTLSTIAGLAAAAVGLITGVSGWPVWGVATAVAAVAAGHLRPGLRGKGYEAWRRLSGGLARRASLVLERLAFGIVAVVGWAGGDMPRSDEPGTSAWRLRSTLQSHVYPSPGLASTPDTRAGWLRSLLAWSRGAGQGWVWALVPVLCLQRLLRPNVARGTGGTNYTLY